MKYMHPPPVDAPMTSTRPYDPVQLRVQNYYHANLYYPGVIGAGERPKQRQFANKTLPHNLSKSGLTAAGGALG